VQQIPDTQNTLILLPYPPSRCFDRDRFNEGDGAGAAMLFNRYLPSLYPDRTGIPAAFYHPGEVQPGCLLAGNDRLNLKTTNETGTPAGCNRSPVHKTTRFCSPIRHPDASIGIGSTKAMGLVL